MSATSQKPQSERQDKGPGLLVVAFLLTFVASIVVTLRVYIRIWVKHTFGWDDGFVIFSLLLAIASTACNVPAVIGGYGQHVQYLSHHQQSEAAKWTALATPLYFLSLAASKVSICILLLRVLKQTQAKLNRYFPYAVIAILTIIAVPFAGYSLGQCQPVSKWWNPTTPGHCNDFRIYVRIAYANGSINAICDFALALFPITFVKDLRLPNHKKVVLGLLMSCGVVCGSIAIARTVLNGELNGHSDSTYASIGSTILVIVEENTSIVVACVPTLGPFFEFVSNKVKSLNSRRYHTQLEETAPPLRKEDSIPLRSITDPICPVTDYESSAEPLDKSCQGIYGSQTGLVHGIQKTTRVDVLRGDKVV